MLRSMRRYEKLRKLVFNDGQGGPDEPREVRRHVTTHHGESLATWPKPGSLEDDASRSPSSSTSSRFQAKRVEGKPMPAP